MGKRRQTHHKSSAQAFCPYIINIFCMNAPAMRLHYLPWDAQTQSRMLPETLSIRSFRIESVEDFIKALLRNTGTLILDNNYSEWALFSQQKCDDFGISWGVD